MSKTIIFRVENKQKVGMYRDERTSYLMQGYQHPPPSRDSALCEVWDNLYEMGEHSGYIFGFATLEQLKSWIYEDEWRFVLNSFRFHVYMYETDDYYEGDTQAIFRKSTAKRVGMVSLTHIQDFTTESLKALVTKDKDHELPSDRAVPYHSGRVGLLARSPVYRAPDTDPNADDDDRVLRSDPRSVGTEIEDGPLYASAAAVLEWNKRREQLRRTAESEAYESRTMPADYTGGTDRDSERAKSRAIHF